MNNILIQNLETLKVYTEEQLAELFPHLKADNIELRYSGGSWLIHYSRGRVFKDFFSDVFPLNPDMFGVSFANSMPIDKVREMVEQLKAALVFLRCGELDPRKDDAFCECQQVIDSIASKYVRTR